VFQKIKPLKFGLIMLKETHLL